MLRKLGDLEIVAQDDELVYRFVSGKLHHEPTWAQARALFGMLETLRGGQSCEDFRLPSDILLRPVKAHEQRLPHPDTQEMCLYDANDNVWLPVLPRKHLEAPAWRLCVNVTDRGPIVNAALSTLTQQGYLFIPFYGFFHHQWNAVKRAAKRTCGGRSWKAVTELNVVYRMNLGPYGSQAWHTTKREFLDRFIRSHTKYGEAFQSILPTFGPANGQPDYHRPESLDILWDKFTSMRSFREVGPSIKMMRWMSVKEVVDFYRAEMAGLKLILELMRDSRAKTSAAAGQAEAADVEVEPEECLKKALSSQRGDTLRIAPRAINQKNQDAMDAWLLSCTHDQDIYGTRASCVKSPQSGYEYHLQLFRGGWRKYFANVAKKSVADIAACQRIGCDAHGERGRSQCLLLMEGVFRLCRERCQQVRKDRIRVALPKL